MWFLNSFPVTLWQFITWDRIKILCLQDFYHLPENVCCFLLWIFFLFASYPYPHPGRAAGDCFRTFQSLLWRRNQSPSAEDKKCLITCTVKREIFPNSLLIKISKEPLPRRERLSNSLKIRILLDRAIDTDLSPVLGRGAVVTSTSSPGWGKLILGTPPESDGEGCMKQSLGCRSNQDHRAWMTPPASVKRESLL